MFNGKEAGAVPLEEARELVGRWRKQASALPGDPTCEFFGRDILDKILAQEGCVGLRIYHGRNPGGQHVLVLVGTDAGGADMVDGIIAEQGKPCPPYCPEGSSLHA